MSTPPLATDETVAILMKGLEARCLLKPLHDLCRGYNVTIQSVLGKKRNRRVTVARAACCARLRMTGFSYPEIGEMLGMCHTSAIDAVRRHTSGAA